MKKFYFLPLLVFPCLISAQDVSTLRLDSIITTDNDEIVVKFEKYKYDDNNNQLFKTGYDNTGNYLKMDSTIQIFDANNRVTFLEKRSYPKTSKYPGWKGSGKEFTSYYDNDKVHTKLSLSFNQPNSDADGYYYESSKAQYTYNEDGTTASYLMSSGQWNTTLTDKILYTYEYDDLKRVTTQNMYKKDDNGEWTLPDSKKINVYTINPKYPESETLMNYDGENFVNKSRVTMTFHPEFIDREDEAYWDWSATLNDWVGTSKTSYEYLSKDNPSKYYTYTWSNGDWSQTKYSDYTFNADNQPVLKEDFTLSSDGDYYISGATEYGYDNLKRTNMTAYYSYTSAGIKKGSLKTEQIFDDNDNETERISQKWDSNFSKWYLDKKTTTTYHETNDIASKKEDVYNVNDWEPNTKSAYYYTVVNSDTKISESVNKSFSVITGKGFMTINLENQTSDINIFDLSGKMVYSKKNASDASTIYLQSGIYVVNIYSGSFKIYIH